MQLIYNIEVLLILKEPTTINLDDEALLEKVIIRGRENKLKDIKEGIIIEFYFLDIEEEKAEIISENFISHVKRVFYFEENVLIKKWNLEQIINEKKKEIIFHDNIVISSSVEIIPVYKNADRFVPSLISTSDYKKPYIDLFMSITGLKDNIGKYVMLYSMLTALLGNQKEVDTFIRRVYPEVLERKTTLPKMHFTETIYTYLRNQIGHTSDQVKVHELNKEVDRHLEGLAKVVKKSLH